jgi:hypothetical protein
MSGLLGYGACYEATHAADLLLLLGTDFPYDSFLPQAHAVQIDRDPSHLGRRSILDLGIAGDVGQTLRTVLPLPRRKTRRTFLDRMLKQHAEALERVVAAYTRNIEHMRPIHPEYVAAQLDSLAAEDAIFTVDTGMCNVWGARYLTPNGRRRVLGSLRHGSMANALSHAVGAQLAAPNRQVVSMSGDGSLSMLMGELITAHTHQLPLTVVVFNNSSLGMIRLEMMVAGYPFYQTDHALVDYAAIAAACGCRPAPWTIRPRFATLSRRRWRTTGHRSSTCAPTRTRSHCRPTSPASRSKASPCLHQNRSRRRRGADARARTQQPAKHLQALTTSVYRRGVPLLIRPVRRPVAKLHRPTFRAVRRPGSQWGYAPTAAAIPGTCSSTDSISVSSMR